MNIKLTVDGKEIALTEEQIKALGLQPEAKRTGYERTTGGRVYYANSSKDEPLTLADNDRVQDRILFESANYVTDRQLCINNARADQLMRQLRRFAALNGGIPSKSDFDNVNRTKHIIEYNALTDKFVVSVVYTHRYPGMVFFNSLSACEDAIQKFHDELLWYFTEYEPMLR